MSRTRIALASLALLLAPALLAEPSTLSISNQFEALRQTPDADRPAAIKQLAADIASLHPSEKKVKLADALVGPVTEGETGMEAHQTVADTLTNALAESPQPLDKSGLPAQPYMDLARLVRYEGAKTSLKDPLYFQAMHQLIADDIDAAHADFTLTDVRTGKKVTLSDLRGKVVLINFWRTGSPQSKKEMPSLQFLSDYFKSQGLVILSITDEPGQNIVGYLHTSNYEPEVLLDPGGKVEKQFHVDEVPRTYIYNRQGKLVGEAINMRTEKEFLLMLSRTDLHPKDAQ